MQFEPTTLYCHLFTIRLLLSLAVCCWVWMQVWFQILSQHEQHFPIHFFLHTFYQLLYLEQNANMLLISFFFHSWKLKHWNPLWSLPNEKQTVFSNKTATIQWWEGALGPVREASSNKVCLLHWGTSCGWSWSEVKNTSAVDTPINLQSQHCLLLSKQFLCEAMPETHTNPSHLHT